MSTSVHYATSLSDEQWGILQLLLPEPTWQPGGPGRPPLDLRRVLDSIFARVYTPQAPGPVR